MLHVSALGVDRESLMFCLCEQVRGTFESLYEQVSGTFVNVTV